MQCIHWARVDRFLSAGPSSLVPNHHSMKDSLYVSMVAGDLYGPCRQLQMNHSPKKHKLGRFFFSHKLVFFPNPENFPQQKKSKLLKDWVQSCFDFWYTALLKRDLATRQCSEDEHCPSDSTQCQRLSQRKTQRNWEGKKKKEIDRENDSVTCYETVSIFNFQFYVKF